MSPTASSKAVCVVAMLAGSFESGRSPYPPRSARGFERADSSAADRRRDSHARGPPGAMWGGRLAGRERRVRRPMRRCLTALAVIALAGCCGLPSTSQPLPQGHLIPTDKPRSTPVSRTLILVADNQLHHLYGMPVRFLRTSDADRLVRSALRPVRLDFKASRTDNFRQRCEPWAAVDIFSPCTAFPDVLFRPYNA